MAAPTLGVYEWQYKDDGFRLNGSTALPFIDVSKVQGLDMPDIEEATSNYDARHGGYGYARFVGLRTIIITGTLYAAAASVDTVLDTLKSNFMPSDTEYPFYLRGAGPAQRYIMCKSLGIKYDIDRLRSIGSSPIQIQLLAGDVTQYIDNNDVTVTSGNSGTVTNDGNLTTYPVIELTGAATRIQLTKVSTGETVTLTYTTDADDVVVIDFNTRSCMINGEKNSTYLTSLGWWGLDPGVATTFRVSAISTDLMTNGSCEANFGAGYAVGANWEGTQQFTGEKHDGSRSLRMRRRNTTTANGNVTIPTGLTGLAAGTYTVSLWLKGSMGLINIGVFNGASSVASISNAAVSSTTWKKFSLTFTLAATSGTMTIQLNDLNTTKKFRVKNKYLYIDDMDVRAIQATTVTAVVSTKDGWM